MKFLFEPRQDKTNKMAVRPAKTQISLRIRPVWSESSLSAGRNLWSSATHWAHNVDSDQTGRIPRLIWDFAGRRLILLVLSCRGSFGVLLFFLFFFFLFFLFTVESYLAFFQSCLALWPLCLGEKSACLYNYRAFFVYRNDPKFSDR